MAAAAATWVLAALLPTSLAALGATHASSFDELLGSACTLAALAVLAWGLLALAFAGLGAAPGVLGRSARRLARRTTPAVARRALAAVLGLASVAVPVAPALATSAPAPVAAGLPSLDRPVGAPDLPPLPELDRPARARPAEAGVHSPPGSGPAALVVVQPGDSLWSIAARHLGASPSDREVAASWPRWYAANRATIGPDPGLLRPGQQLRIP